jgi:lipopolysaccharide export system permease protein
MKIIYRYLFKELLIVSLSTIGVLTFLLVLVNVFKDIFALILNTEVSLALIFKLVYLLIPWTLTYTLPWGLLMAVLLVFGRWSQDRELLALKASGIGIAPIIAPALGMALTFTGISFLVNSYIAPSCRQSFKEIAYEVVTSNPLSMFTAGKPIDQFPGYRLFIVERSGNQLRSVYLWQVDSGGRPTRSIRADSGEVSIDPIQSKIVLKLRNVRQEERVGEGASARIQVGGHADEMPISIPFQNPNSKKQEKRSLGISTLSDLSNEIFYSAAVEEKSRISSMLTEFQKRIAFGFSCLTFTLVGIPLAIQTNRRETSVGVAISLGIVIAYYFLIVLAEAFKKNAAAYPELIVWAPNLIFQALGFYLLWRANKK